MMMLMMMMMLMLMMLVITTIKKVMINALYDKCKYAGNCVGDLMEDFGVEMRPSSVKQKEGDTIRTDELASICQNLNEKDNKAQIHFRREAVMGEKPFAQRLATFRHDIRRKIQIGGQ